MDTSNFNDKNPLLDLVADDNVDLQKVSDILSSFIGIKKPEGKIFLKQDFISLSPQDKLQVLILAAKARFLLNFSQEEEISPKDLVSLSGLPEGTVKSGLKRLRDSHKVEGEGGMYKLPNYRVEELWKIYKKESQAN